MHVTRSTSGSSLLFAGNVFCDLVFAGVDAPEIGGEVYANGFTISPGGVANRAVAAARAGTDTKILGRIGDDPLGTHIRAVLDAEPNLDISLLTPVHGGQTPVSVALTGPHDRSFITYEEPLGALGFPADIGPIGATHIGIEHELPGWVARLRSTGTVVFGGVGWDPTGAWATDVLDRLAEVDVFVPNEVEAMRYTRTDDAFAAAKVLADYVPLAVITRGSDGVLAVDSAMGTMTAVPAIPVDVVDPTGAGDVFVATLMSSSRYDWTLPERLRFAALNAAISVTGHGGAASAPRPGEVADFVRQHHLTRHRLDGDWSFLDAALPTAEPV